MMRSARYVGAVLLIPVLLVAGCPADSFQKQCETDEDCNDGNPCTSYVCKSKVCANAAKSDGVVSTSLCVQTTCTEGTAKDIPVMAGTPCAPGSSLKCDGMGSCQPCTEDAQCGTGSECQKVSCDMGKCAPHNVSKGTDVTMQTAGDCKRNQCDGLGGVEGATDTSDAPPYANDCVDHVCNGGIHEQMPSAVGTMCAMSSGTGLCNGKECVACVTPALGCPPSLACSTDETQCVNCNDGQVNYSETDVDCGGPDCKQCSNGKTCTISNDCASGNCLPSSMTRICCDTDCTDPCRSCILPTTPGVCAPMPKGSIGKCGTSEACDGNGMCVSGLPNGGLCTNSNACVSKLCSGGKCRQDNGTACTTNTDCASNHCDTMMHLCVSCVPSDCQGCANAVCPPQ